MTIEIYPNFSLHIPDLYYLKSGVSCDIRDVLAKTGNTSNGKYEVDKMSSSYLPKDVVGISMVKLSSTYPDRMVTVLAVGVASVNVAKAVSKLEKLQGAIAAITEYFSGNNTALQTVYAGIGKVPISSVTTFKELGGPTTLTRVYVTNPTTNQYYLDNTTGKLIIGGTSVSGTNNYELIYSVDAGLLEPSTEYIEETLTVTTHVATATYNIDNIEYVEATTGSVTGNCGVITAGTVATKEVKLNRSAKTLTFFATDAVTACKVRYKSPDFKPCAIALEAKTAGEQCRVLFKVGGV